MKLAMVALDTNARRKGREAMEKTLTKAAQVRRVLKGGRPRRIRNEALSLPEAALRIVQEANKARALMKEQGLDSNDISCAMVYCTPEVPDSPAWQYKGLPRPEKQNEFFGWFADLGQREAVLFLGILWQLIDRDANPQGVQVSFWLDPFLTGTEIDKRLLAAKQYAEEVIKNGGKPLDN